MAQSIKTQTVSTYKKKYEEKLLCFAEKENLKKRFGIGEKFSKDESLHTIIMNEVLCPKNCDILNFIEDIIRGDEEPLKEYQTPRIESVQQQEELCEKGGCSTTIEW